MRDNNYLKEMGKRIRAIRNEQKITLRELGALCNLQHDAISRIELGEKDSHILTLKTIADNLNVDVKDFV